MADNESRGTQAGWPFRSAFDEMLQQARNLTDLMASTSRDPAGAAGTGPGALPPAVTAMLESWQHLAQAAPNPGAQLDLFLEEIRAKRAMVVALQKQLTAFENQLGVLERSLEPLRQWSRQWGHVQSALTDTLRPPRVGEDPDT